MKLGGNRPPGDNPLLFSISGTGSFIWPVADEAGHTKAFDYPVVEHWGKAEMFSSPGGTRTDNTSVWSRTRYHPGSPKKEIEASYFRNLLTDPHL